MVIPNPLLTDCVQKVTFLLLRVPSWWYIRLGLESKSPETAF
jgi:hypothetical protein